MLIFLKNIKKYDLENVFAESFLKFRQYVYRGRGRRQVNFEKVIENVCFAHMDVFLNILSNKNN